MTAPHDVGSLLAAAEAAPPPAVATDPDVVWHYTDGAGLLSILAHHTLWATDAAFLNDQQELAHGIGRLLQRVRRLVPADRLDRLADAVDPRRVGGTSSSATFFVLSASQSWDSLAMWRLYGRSRESYAIGLDATARLGVLPAVPGSADGLDDAALGRAGVYLRRKAWEHVRYDAEAQDALLDEVLAATPEHAARVRDALARLAESERDLGAMPERTRRLVQDTLDPLEQVVLLLKHPGFAEEREVRHAVVLLADRGRGASLDVETRLLRYRASAYGIAPYLALTGGGAADDAVSALPSPLPIRAVALSPSPNGAAAQVSVDRLLQAHGYRDVEVLRSSIPFRS